MQHKFFNRRFSAWTAVAICVLLLQSCGSALIIPRSVSTASVTTFKDLNLSDGQYDVLRTVSESASVICEFGHKSIRITSGEGDFFYHFIYDSKSRSWTMNKFSGAVSMGYFTKDYVEAVQSVPIPDDFARRAAMARIINTAIDFSADGIVEPITVMSASEIGRNKIEYKATVRAKLISLKTK